MESFKKVDGKKLGEALFGDFIKDLTALRDGLQASIVEQEKRIKELKDQSSGQVQNIDEKI
jgi:hypothetical protein